VLALGLNCLSLSDNRVNLSDDGKEARALSLPSFGSFNIAQLSFLTAPSANATSTSSLALLKPLFHLDGF